MKKLYDILVVDDEPPIIEYIKSTFEQFEQPYNMITAKNGEMALKTAKLELPDIILTDWDMPVVNGIDFIRNLKNDESTKNIPVFMVTGVMTSDKNMATAMEAGALDFIRKPIDKFELISRTRTMLKLSISHKEIVALKNRELASLSMTVFKNNEFNHRLIERLKTIEAGLGSKNRKLSNELCQIRNEIDEFNRSDLWQRYEDYFKNVQPDFHSNLLKKHPDLTPAEIRLCYFLRLNMTTKEIATVLSLANNSVKIARSRLKNKLRVDNIKNLTAYLLSL